MLYLYYVMLVQGSLLLSWVSQRDAGVECRHQHLCWIQVRTTADLHMYCAKKIYVFILHVQWIFNLEACNVMLVIRHFFYFKEPHVNAQYLAHFIIIL